MGGPGRLWMVEGKGRVRRSPVRARASYQRAQGRCVRLSSLCPSSPDADLNVPPVAIAMQLRSRPCQRKPIFLTCRSAYVVVLCVHSVGAVLDFLSVSVSVPSVAEIDRGIEPFLSHSFLAHIRRRRVVRVPKLTRPTKHLTRKLPSCLRKRVGGMNLEATRMDTPCCSKYASANTVASCTCSRSFPSACIRHLHHPHPHPDPPIFHPTTSPHSVQALVLHVHSTLLIPKSFRLLPRLGCPQRTARLLTR